MCVHQECLTHQNLRKPAGIFKGEYQYPVPVILRAVAYITLKSRTMRVVADMTLKSRVERTVNSFHVRVRVDLLQVADCYDTAV